MWKEIRIPVTHGHLAAKAWGNPSANPIIAIHGWLDNANSFDKLIPFLPPNLYVVCLDLSGHGLSDHLGAGSFYNSFVFYTDIKCTIEHFGWKKVGLLGHSMGGGIVMSFAALYPNLVEHLICLDHLPLIRATESVITQQGVVRYIEEMHKHNKRKLGKPFVQPKEAIIDRLQILYNNLSRESLELLMDRGLAESTEKKGLYYYTRDDRCKSLFFPGLNGISFEVYLNEILPNYRGRCVIIYASSTAPLALKFEDKIKTFIDVLRKNCSQFEIKEVQGFHHFHMDNPEGVAKEIRTFLDGKIPYRAVVTESRI